MLHTAGEIQALVRAVTSTHFPAAGRRYPDPPKEPAVRVEALTATWRMNGRTVEVGAVYVVPLTEAGTLVFTGKARRV